MSIHKTATGKPARLAVALGVAAAAVLSLATSSSAATASYTLSPATGGPGAGTVVTVTGTGFKDASGVTQVATVYFDSATTACTWATRAGATQTAATHVSVTSATKLVITAPALSTATTDPKAFQVCVYSGSALLGIGQFKVYHAPTISAATPLLSGR